MPKEENMKLLDSLMNDLSSGGDDDQKGAIDQQQQTQQQEPVKQDDAGEGEELVLPKYQQKLKAPKQTPEESAAILRKQRDEARQRAEELEAQLEKASTQGTIFDEVKKLINKDEVTPEDLKQIFDDYEFTKKEKAALEANLKETQGKLREYDISNDPDFIQNYIHPVQIATDSLKAEICPIVGDDYVPVPNGAEQYLEELIIKGNINPTSVKLALTKIRDAYDAADIDYEMPSVRNVTNYLLDIQKGIAAKNKAVEEWEIVKAEKQKELEEQRQQKSSLIQVKSRQERRKMAQEFLDRFAKADDFDYLAELQGADDVIQTVADSHSFLTEIMDDPAKAPTYDGLLEAYTKARLYDKLIEDKKAEMKIAVSKKEKAKIENIARPSSNRVDKSANPNLDLLRNYGVQV